MGRATCPRPKVHLKFGKGQAWANNVTPYIQLGRRARQQPKSNAFGFGTQAISHQQQKPNPFGFGVQNNAQSKGANDFGNKQSQFKNTWTRSSASSGAPSLRQSDNQPQATNHRCNDPESCKRIIAEDFEHERPLWKLTCYSHWKSMFYHVDNLQAFQWVLNFYYSCCKDSPCDIVGDVSYEELRAAAYDDAKRGLSLQSIVRRSSIPYFPDLQLHIERERNLLNSKLVEFENFLRNPYRGPAGSAAAQQIPFPGATTTVLSPTTQNTVAPQSNVPPSVSSFSQLGASLNTGFSPVPSVQSNNASGQPTSFSNSAQSSNVFSANNVPLANAFSFGNQQPNQSVAASFPTNMANFSNSSAINPAINQFSAAAVSTQNFSSSSIQSPAFLNVSLSNSEAVGREATNVQLGYVNGEISLHWETNLFYSKNCLVASLFVFVLPERVYWYDGISVGNKLILISECDRNNLPTTVASGDSNIWLKEKWTPGEIPEEAPPDAYV
ncbi:hypothetical protein CXB51_004575 [Gossypium anomalum]|uniref:Uncharacterized protein n=1 Tax=Gossypium anomalum TaxID=47600 RepID=A0A8J5ZQ61_9ROSI|nr:hypothetical protein CXB51_004575 [Gossypium anomalum]